MGPPSTVMSETRRRGASRDLSINRVSGAVNGQVKPGQGRQGKLRGWLEENGVVAWR